MTREDYLAQLAALLPTGAALPRDPASAFMRLLEMPAAELAAVDGRVAALLTEADPRATAELLAEWERDFGLPDDCSPLESFSRASPATWFDGAGTLQEAGIDQPRPEVDPVTGALTGRTIVEPAGQNLVVNPRGEGAVAGVVGSGGAWPSFSWSPTGAFTAGLAADIVAVTVIGGRRRISVRFSGVATNNSFTIAFGPNQTVEAGLAYTGSAYLAAGISPLPPNEWRLNVQAQPPSVRAIPIDAVLRRHITSFVASVTAASRLQLQVMLTNGASHDFTLVMELPQLEPGAVATSVILPPVGAPAVSSRAADILTTATAAERRGALLARMLGAPGQSRAYFIALAATLGYPGATVEEFRMPRAGLFAAGDACHGYDWSQAWRLRVAEAASRFARAGEAVAGDPLTSFGDGRLECAIRRAAPAHTLPLIAYGA